MAFGCDKKFRKKSDMFWYPSGPIFKSNLQNGTKIKSNFFLVFIVTMLLVELELIKTFEIDKKLVPAWLYDPLPPK